MFSLAPGEDSAPAKPSSVPCWDLVQTGVQGALEFPLPLRHMLLSLLPRPDEAAGATAWSLPAPIRPDFPRLGLSVPREPDSGGGPSSRWVKPSVCGLQTVTEHSETGTGARLARGLKRRGIVAGHSLLNAAAGAKGEIPSIFPPSVPVLSSRSLRFHIFPPVCLTLFSSLSPVFGSWQL